jgi:predicted aspartyl protease
MRLLALLSMAAIVAAPLSARGGDDAAALLLKHKMFAGWQAGDGSLSTLTFTGDMTKDRDGKAYAQVKELRKGLAFRETTKQLEHGTVENNGFTGRVFWESNRNGFTHPVRGDAEKYAISEELVFNEGLSELPATVNGNDTVSGVACTIVQVKADASFPINACIDPQTGAVKRVVIDPDGSYETQFDILDYANAAPGKRVISAWHYKGSDYTHHWTSVVANAQVSDADLHPPAQTATWSFANGQPFPIEYEHTDVARGIYLTATIDGVKGRFLMDTGASEIVLNRSFAGRAHLKPLYPSAASGIGGTTKTEVQRAETLQIGGNTLSNVIVSTFGYDMWNGKENGEELDGIIGYDLFGGAIVNVDLDSQQMTLYDPSTMQVDGVAGIPLDVDLQSLQPMIPMKVNGTIPIRAILDSGDLMAHVTFSQQLASKYGLRMVVDTSVQGITRGIQFASGVGGISRMRCGTLDSLSIGPIVYQSAPACQSGDFEDNWAIVGYDFVEHFNMLFDYPQGKLVLIPRPNV